MPRISVIVPVYNTEKYLRRCVDSILAQTFRDFELLLVDDGSTDSSPAICDEYAKKDSRVRVFHKENGGVSSARNLGLDNARGEWIAFADSDDHVNVEYLTILMRGLELDWVASSYRILGDKGGWLTQMEDGIYIGKDLYKCYQKYLSTNFRTPWGKRYKRELIHNIRFPLSMNVGEDLAFNLEYACNVNSIGLSSQATYLYNRKNENSLTHILREDVTEDFFYMISNKINKLNRVKNVVNNSIVLNLLGYPFFSLILEYTKVLKFTNYTKFKSFIQSKEAKEFIKSNIRVEGYRFYVVLLITKFNSLLGWLSGKIVLHITT